METGEATLPIMVLAALKISRSGLHRLLGYIKMLRNIREKMATRQKIRIVIMIKSAAAGTINENVVAIAVEAEVLNEEMIVERRGREEHTDIKEGTMIRNEKSVVTKPAVDPCRQKAHQLRRQHPLHHILPLETALSEDIVMIVTGTNEGTKVKAEKKKEVRRPNDIGRGGNGLNLFHHHHILLHLQE